MFNPSREQVRRFFCDAWRKQRQGLPLAGGEIAAADLAARHPEYHALLADVEGALNREWTPEGGQMNPFLHLSLHLAIHEQLSIDQPPGIRAAFTHLLQRMERHDAEHVLLEALGEAVWHAQRNGGQLDAAAYVDAVRRQAGTA
ncbi:MAG: DUF1841 family protein [Betaproteobacteria bacterium]|nr:DUF1841 family protein [Betaproteobacteria bacterium]MCL2885850.1 DUF1841 family protein [Betaproteobacteria bacterium]